MPREVLVALITAGATAVGALLVLLVGLRSIRVELSKLQEAKDYHERELSTRAQQVWIEMRRVEGELRALAEQEQVWKAEAGKLEQEATMMRHRRVDEESHELKRLLALFDRAAFQARFSQEDPALMLNAMRATRIALQTSGAAFYAIPWVADRFTEITRALHEAEQDVVTSCPMVAQIAEQAYGRDEYHYQRPYWQWCQELGADRPGTPKGNDHAARESGQQALRRMYECRTIVADNLQKLRVGYEAINQQVDDG